VKLGKIAVTSAHDPALLFHSVHTVGKDAVDGNAGPVQDTIDLECTQQTKVVDALERNNLCGSLGCLRQPFSAATAAAAFVVVGSTRSC
jgi:hypothetical protein